MALHHTLVSTSTPVSATLATFNGVTLTGICEFQKLLLKVTTDATVFGTIGKAADGTVFPFEENVTDFAVLGDPDPLGTNQPPPGESSFFVSLTVQGAGNVDVRMVYQRFDTAGQCRFDGVVVPTS